MLQLEHDGRGGEQGIEDYGGLPASGAGAHDGTGEIQRGGAGGQLPDVVRGGVRPFARGKREEAECVERQQPGIGAQEVEAFEDQPIDQEKALRLPERRPGIFVQAAGEVSGDESEDSEAVPLVAVGDVEQRGGQRDENEYAEGSDFGDGQGDERQEAGEPGDGLRAVFQGVDDHAGGDGEQEERGGEGVIENLGGGDGIHGVNGGVERGPSAADQAVGEGAVFFAALEDDAGEEHGEGGGWAALYTTVYAMY